MVRFICTCPFEVNGKTTFKEEFVTAGGVDLQELDLTTFALKGYPNIFLAGEVLNIDGLTGGFNFQHAWTSGFLAGTASGERLL
jgi:predicted flavoprotein YhiN